MPHSRKTIAASHAVCVIARRLLAFEAEAFDQDLPVSGADLVGFWAEIRPELKGAVGALPQDYGLDGSD